MSVHGRICLKAQTGNSPGAPPREQMSTQASTDAGVSRGTERKLTTAPRTVPGPCITECGGKERLVPFIPSSKTGKTHLHRDQEGISQGEGDWQRLPGAATILFFQHIHFMIIQEVCL